MRYQERLYIQNQNSSIRNRAISNVNMSSDMCIFSNPVFGISGATKINCFTGCSCPAGYILDADGLGCTEVTSTGATFNNLGPIIKTGNTHTDYSQYGAYFYPSIQNNESLPLWYDGIGLYLRDKSGGTINPTNIVNSGTFWMSSGSTSNGRLNNVGISASSTEYVGFSKCLDITESGTYYIGLAADNYCRVRLNGKTYIDFSGTVQENFKIWSVFPFELQAGLNIIEMEANNISSTITAFGAEVYHPSSLTTLTAATTTGSVGLLFSTKDKIGGRFDLGTTIGWSCPTGYSLNTCANFECSKIQKSACTGTTANMSSGSTGVYIIGSATTIPLTFNFTSNTSTFTANSVSFKYEIYKYANSASIFIVPPVYKSDIISYSAFSGTNILSQEIPVSALTLDGDYLIKGYYEFNTCTDFLNRLGKKIDTTLFKNGPSYQLYEPSQDYYLIGITEAAKPKFRTSSNTDIIGVAPLFQEIVFVDDTDGPTNIVVVVGEFASNLIMTLNGAVLAEGLDYTYSGNVVTFSGSVNSTDVVTAIYNRTGGTNITADVINVTTIASGATNAQGNNQTYYNTTTGKYEIYTNLIPVVGNNIIVVINGATLANGIDYYQSTSNPSRIILEGNIMIDDVINIIYYPQASVINGVTTTSYTIVWSIDETPQLENGLFTLQLSTGSTFNTIIYSATTPYQVNVGIYHAILQISGDVGTKLYYRVKNNKQYVSMCGEVINSLNFSETIPITISTNSINSY